MMKKQRRTTSFILALPTSVMLSCTPTQPPSNPPPQTQKAPEPPVTQQADPPPMNPPVPNYPTYSQRMKSSDGKCIVQQHTPSPATTEVSCTAPIEPAPSGDTWCRVEKASDPKEKIPVLCEKTP